jgi:hypothetical protein
MSELLGGRLDFGTVVPLLWKRNQAQYLDYAMSVIVGRALPMHGTVPKNGSASRALRLLGWGFATIKLQESAPSLERQGKSTTPQRFGDLRYHGSPGRISACAILVDGQGISAPSR